MSPTEGEPGNRVSRGLPIRGARYTEPIHMDEPHGASVPAVRIAVGAGSPVRRSIGVIVTLAALTAIALATLRDGDPSVMEPHGHWCLVCGSQGTVDVIQNLVLFAPLGAGLALMGTPLLVVLLVAVGGSTAVELLQATVFTGRAATVSDVLTNSSGATFAFLATRSYRWWLTPTASTASWITAAWGAAWVGALLLTAWALQPDTPRGPYPVMQLPPGSGEARSFEGTILESYIAGLPVASGIEPAGGDVAMSIGVEPLEVHARVTPMSYAPGMYRPVVSLFTQDWRSVTSLGQRYEHLVFSRRLNSSRVRLRAPSVRMLNVFPGTLEQGERKQAPVSLSAGYTKSLVSLRSESAIEERTTTIRITPLHGWALLLPRYLDDGTGTLAFGLLWFAGWMLPLGYWGACAVRGARSAAGRSDRDLQRALPATGLAILGLAAPWLVAPVSGLSTPDPLLLAAGCSAMVAGALAAVARLASR